MLVGRFLARVAVGLMSFLGGGDLPAECVGWGDGDFRCSLRSHVEAIQGRSTFEALDVYGSRREGFRAAWAARYADYWTGPVWAALTDGPALEPKSRWSTLRFEQLISQEVWRLCVMQDRQNVLVAVVPASERCPY